MRYENEKCPVCGEVFNENDEIVVCPDCATPQHKNCYNEQGRCANEHLHGEGYVWQKTEQPKPQEKPEPEAVGNKQEDTVTCPECGAENKQNAFICTNCGAVVNEEVRQQFQAPKTDTIFIEGKPVNDNDFIDAEGTVTVKDAACFIQRGKESYIKTFLDAKYNNRKPKFNIFAFLFGPYWFFYRKIYKPGFAFLGLSFAITCFMMAFFFMAYREAIDFLMSNVNAFAEGTASIDLYNHYQMLIQQCIQENPKEILVIMLLGLLMFALNIVAGIFANKLYLNHIKTTISKIRTVVPNLGAYYTYLYAKGGTTFLNVFLIGFAINYLTEMIFSYSLM